MNKPKPFTSYVCPVGAGRMGHSSLYTGDGHLSKQGDGVCLCGREMIEEASTKDGHRYRLTFDSIDPFQADEMVQRHGKEIWPRLSQEEWAALRWFPPTSKESETLSGLQAQYETLSGWAASHEQPIRNVQLHKQAVEAAWIPVQTAEPGEGG